MSQWTEYRIGDFLERIKRPIPINDECDYQLLTIKLYHKGLLPRQIKKGSDIKAKTMFKVQTGDFILSGIDARNGAFGIVPKELDGAVVTNDFWYFEIKEEIIDKQFFLELTKTGWFDDLCNKGSEGTTNRVRLQKDKFFEQLISLPDLSEQIALRKKLIDIRRLIEGAKGYINDQIEFVNQLRQSILQEAVQGKLTSKWRSENPDVEPASELLKRIAAEKQKLIAEKKIKKEKPLPPIEDEDKPYDLPDGWVWCRLGELLLFTDAGKSPSCEKRPVSDNEWGVLTTTSIQLGRFLENENKVLPLGFQVNESMAVELGDVLITRAGPLNRTGIACRVSSLSKLLILSDKTIRLKHVGKYVDGDYLVLMLNSSVIRDFLKLKMSGMAESQVNISQSNIKLTQIPFPALNEQQAIVQKVNALMALCDELEQQIDNSQNQIEQLMQSCLKEVFEEG